jgi:small multidrug resistance pump/quaternary ammonium compound-resistance protein SugE
MYCYLSLAAALTFVAGGVFMKWSEGMSRLVPTLLVYLFFAAGATCQTVAMRKAEMGVSYLLVLGLEAVLAFVFGLLFFGEERSPCKLLGVAVVVAGIVLLHADEVWR